MNKNENVVNFSIDDTPSKKNANKKPHEEVSLDFQALLQQNSNNPIQVDFSFSNKSVIKAGRRLRKKEGDLKQATATIQTFRAAHEKPLNAISDLIANCCAELGIEVKPVKRLKRLETIIDKLQRKTLNGQDANATCVSNMNDIGGCRAIFPDMESLNIVKKRLFETSENQIGISIKSIDNYIQEKKPTDCGYRSLHIIYQYQHCEGKKFRIEAQLRTKLQHLWATTVEIVDILEGTKIKTHSHSDDSEKSEKQVLWEELLSIMSDFIAEAEGVVNFPCSQKQLYVSRLIELNIKLNAVNRLTSFKMASENIDIKSENTSHVLLIVNNNTSKVIQEIFNNQAHAIAAYSAVEKVIADIKGLNILLVSTKNLDQLSDAYPNYIGDCASFIELLRDEMNLK